MTSSPVDALALAVFGHLRRRELPEGEEDCYSVFHAASSLLGFIAPMGSGGRDLWGMNDAGGPWFPEEGLAMCGWFQVSPLDEHTLGLPLASFTATSAATLERFGPLEVGGYEYYLPLRVAGPSQRQILNAENWFALAAPTARARIALTLDSGDSRAVAERSGEILEALAAVAPSEEGVDPSAAEDDDRVEFAQRVPWRWWLGDGTPSTTTFAATATDWSPIGVGRVASFVSEACRSIGMTDHIGLRIARSGPPQPPAGYDDAP